MSHFLSFISQMDSIIIIGLFLIIMVAQVLLLFFPKDAVLLYVGVLFGFVGGGLINILGMVAASWFGYEIGRTEFMCNNRVTTKKSFLKVRSWIEAKGMKSVVMIRALPLVPYNIVSLSSGVSQVSRWKYLLITFIFAIPYAFFWAYIGSRSLELIANNL